ncbi:MAG: hypothetical protein IJN94_01185 [Clostridia bacterium]|nr:hypothetical protein [Clostridia bacterium]
MIKIAKISDLDNITDTKILPYLNALVEHILSEYEQICCSNSIERFGAIFFIENESDFDLYKKMGLSSPLNERRFEYIDEIRGDYYNGLIILDNERCINLIGKKEYFSKLLEDCKNENN